MHHSKPEIDDFGAPQHAAQTVLYPVNISRFKLPEADDFKIQFLASTNPFGLIHFLESRFPKALCFGIGSMSAVLILGPRDTFFDCASVGHYAPVVASETWTVKGGKLKHSAQQIVPGAAVAIRPLQFDEKLLDPTTVLTLTELSLNLSKAMHLARTYAPEALPDLEAAFEEAQNTINALTTDREKLAKHGEQIGSGMEQSQLKRQVDSCIEWLVQMNSALVYLGTQAFHGAAPILRHSPLISYQSVLGTGTAWRGVARLARRLFSVLSNPPLPPLLAAELLSEEAQKAVGAQHNRRIVHFSGRLGFGETDVTITCPSQSIALCSTAEWSVVTLTHEVLHAYVKEILAALFVYERNGKVTLGEEGWRMHADDLAACIARWGKNKAAETTGTPATKLRWHLFRFAAAYQGADAEARARIERGAPLHAAEFTLEVSRSSDRLIETFRSHGKLIEEIMVHVLDLLYFYDRDPVLFVESLWVTWASVPSVMGKLDYYIIRTLIGLLAVFDGKGFAPLTQGIEILVGAMTKLSRMADHAVVARSVLATLQQKAFRLKLDLLYPSAKTFVDIIRETCSSSILAQKLADVHEPLLSSDGDCILEDCAFDSIEVRDALAFARSILKRRLDSLSEYHDDIISISRDSAWLLLGLASKSNIPSHETNIA